jgi:signal transduction histidine kinase
MFLASLMFHDAWLCHSRAVPWLYALTFPIFDVYLLVLDEFGRVGLRSAYAEKPGVVVGMLVTQVIVCLAMFAFIREVDRRSDASDKALAERERADFRAAVLRKEREVIRRSVGLLSSGISASQFSHDVATPVTALRMNLAFLRDRLAGDTEALPAIVDAETVAREIHAMTEALSRSLRDCADPTATAVEDITGRAVRYAQDLLRARGAVDVQPAVDVDAARVWVVDGHVSALANLVVNAVVHSGQSRVDVRGRVLNDDYYELSLRDFGVTGNARDSAMTRIRRSMSLIEPQLERMSELGEWSTGPVVRREGYGVGLMISRLHCVRYGGEIDVAAAPDAGPGIVFRVLLARATDGDRRWGTLS